MSKQVSAAASARTAAHGGPKGAAMRDAEVAKRSAPKAKKQAPMGLKAMVPAAMLEAAAPKAKPAKTADVMPTGAANGAADQPHTKQALKQQRAAEKAAFDATKDAQVAAGMVYLLDPARNVSKWFPAKGKHPVGAVQLYPSPKGQSSAEPKAAAKAKPAAKAGDAPKTKVPRTTGDKAYKSGPKTNDAKAGSWRHYMLTTIQAHKGTEAAKAAHAKSGQFASNALDFNWSAKQGYITFA